jgi:hypothetical protein
MHEGRAEKIRLHGIDCPEMGQPFGKRAKQFTSDMVFGKIVEVKPTDRDRYGRTVAWVYVDSICLNKELLKVGLAWHYKQYSKDNELAILELVAQKKKIGLWSDPHAISPWEFRHEPDKSAVVEEQPARPQPAITPATPQPTEPIVYHGNTQSHVFHRPGCRYYNCKNCTAVFHSREAAISTGYRPCKVCNP